MHPSRGDGNGLYDGVPMTLTDNSAGILSTPPAEVVRGFGPLDRLMSRGEARPAKLLTRGCARADSALVAVLERLIMSRDAPDLSGDIQGRMREMARVYASEELLAAPADFFPAPPLPRRVTVKGRGRLRGGLRLRLSFPSSYKTHDPAYQPVLDAFGENRQCHALLLTHGQPGAPTVVCIHFWFGGHLTLDERVLAARAYYRAGLDVVLFTLPFHGARTPRQARLSGQLFPNRDLQRTNEAFGQAVWDLRGLLRWLREERGAGPTGLVGLSLGGYTASLLAGLVSDLAFVVPIMAPCSFADVFWLHGEGRPGRAQAESVGFSLWDFRTMWAAHTPLMHRPRLPRDRLLIVMGQGDRVVPLAHPLALARHWGGPRTMTYPGSHLVPLGRGGYVKAVTRWITERVL